ncbi:MAG: Tlg2-vesicle protein [Piccolia ochrophora]|nr:MAG: Tlg2-vesicle protein [Piccolia ochrophora]
MPADYDSTARALSVSLSPPDSPSQPRPSFVPQWNRSRSSSTLPRTRASAEHGPRSLKEQSLHHAEHIYRQLLKTVGRMTWWQRILAAAALLLAAVLGLLLLIFTGKIFEWLEVYADRWRALRAGWMIVAAMVFVCAFPPVIGFSSSVTIAGFLYGLRNGWLIVSAATVVGSLCSFLLSRTIFSGYVHRLVENDRRFAALALTLKHDGLKLLVMIRFCPLPYSLSNGAMATFPTVHPLMFALATAISTPKLLIPVFIGGRLATLAEDGAKMDATTKVVNVLSIAGGGVLGVSVGWFIYQRTMARAQQLEAEERARLLEDPGHVEAGRHFSDDPEEERTAVGRQRDANDDISLFEQEINDGYRDDVLSADDHENDIFQEGDGDADEEETVGVGDEPSTRA